jgi:hypothetical protein
MSRFARACLKQTHGEGNHYAGGKASTRKSCEPRRCYCSRERMSTDFRMSFVFDAYDSVCGSTAAHFCPASNPPPAPSAPHAHPATASLRALGSHRSCEPSPSRLRSCPSIRPLLAPRPPSSAGLRLLQRPGHLPFRVDGLPVAFVRKRTQLRSKTRFRSTRNWLAKRGPG